LDTKFQASGTGEPPEQLSPFSKRVFLPQRDNHAIVWLHVAGKEAQQRGFARQTGSILAMPL
jgi:hypothetical protein